MRSGLIETGLAPLGRLPQTVIRSALMGTSCPWTMIIGHLGRSTRRSVILPGKSQADFHHQLTLQWDSLGLSRGFPPCRSRPRWKYNGPVS